MQHWTFLYCFLAGLLVASLVSVIRSGLDRRTEMSRLSRGIRVIGGSLWLAFVLGGIAFRVWETRR